MTLFREHRGSMEKSLATVREFAWRAALVTHLHAELLPYFDVVDDMVEIKLYGGPGTTPGWKQTYVVTVRGFGVAGFTDGPLDATMEAAAEPHVLIILSSVSGTRIGQIPAVAEFATKAACETAAKWVSSRLKGRYPDLQVGCFPKA